MANDPSVIDLPKLFALYVKTKNASLVAREFETSRFIVKKLWNNLSKEDQLKYENQIIQKRQEAIDECSKMVKYDTKEYLNMVNDLKATLIVKLTDCVADIVSTDKGSISRIKDATTALNILHGLSDEEDSSSTSLSLAKSFTQLAKLTNGE